MNNYQFPMPYFPNQAPPPQYMPQYIQPTYENPFPNFQSQNQIHFDPDTVKDRLDSMVSPSNDNTSTQQTIPKDEPKNKSGSNAKTTKRVNISLAYEEHSKLKLLAKENHMTVSDYIRKTCLHNNTGPVDNASDILEHVATLSNCINLLEASEIKNKMKDEAQQLWRYLNQ